MRKNLLKRYNDFIKVNENQETEAPVEIQQEPAPTKTPDKRIERYTVPNPPVNPDPLAKDGEGVEETEALFGEKVDVEETGKLHKESKSYRNRFRTKL